MFFNLKNRKVYRFFFSNNIKIYFIILFLNILITDPTFNKSYYLYNKGQFNAKIGEDINILPLWERNFSGKGVNIHFIIDACNVDHIDLKENFISEFSYNFNTKDSDVTLSSPKNLKAGTELISIAVAKLNGIGSLGVAYNSNFSIVVPETPIKFIDKFLNQIFFSGLSSYETVVDFFSNVILPPPNSFKYYMYRRVSMIEDYILDYSTCGRNHLGTIFIIPSPLYINFHNDYMCSLFSFYGEVIIVSYSDYQGASGNSQIPFSGILINAPTPGNQDVTVRKSFPSAFASKFSSKFNYVESFVYGMHVSLVTGIVSIMLESNPKLTYRDIQWILLLTATKNDPTNPSWFTNAAGYDYSLIYGFGRVNAEEAINLSIKWLPGILQRLIKFQNTHNNIKILLPYVRQGFIELNFNFTCSNESIVEYIIFNFQLTNPDINMLRIILESPSGTKIVILRPDPTLINITFTHEYYTIEPMQILVRGFLGEKINGQWKVKFIDSSFIRANYLTYSSLSIYGQQHKPYLLDFPKKNGSVSIPPYGLDSKNIFLNLSSTKFYCGKIINATLFFKNENYKLLSMFLVNKSNGASISIRPSYDSSTTFSFKVPCFTQNNSNLSFVVENREYNVYKSIPIEYISFNNKREIIDPLPYQRIISEVSSKFSFIVKFLNYYPLMPPYGEFQKYTISLYNLDTNRRVLSFSSYDNFESSCLITSESSKPPNGIIVVVPNEIYGNDYCSSLISPVLFQIEGASNSSLFSIPLNNFCPIPKGILIEIPTPTNINYNKVLIFEFFIFILFTLILFVIILIFFFYYKKILKKPNDLDDQLLL